MIQVVIQAVFNALICLGLVLGVLASVCHFRIMYHTKDPRHGWYGAFLTLQPDLLTAKGRRLLRIGRLCLASAFLVCLAAVCLGLALPKP